MGVTRSLQALGAVNQRDGFDCPGCAWPDPDDRRSMVEFCENGAKAVAEEAMRATIGREFFAKHSVTALRGKTDFWLGQQGRLSEPLICRAGDDYYRPVEWTEAFDLIGAKLKGLDSPEEAAFYTSGRTSNEAAFLYQAFVRLFGTNNLPDCSNLCHESSGAALNATIGIGKGTVKLDDFNHANLILVTGQNPGTNHPRMLTALQEARRKGAKIVSINPLNEVGLARFGHPQEVAAWFGAGTSLAELHIPVRINGDIALFRAIGARLVKSDDTALLDREFIKKSTAGWQELRAHLLEQDEVGLLAAAGVANEDFEKLMGLICTSRATIVTWAMGLTQHENAVATITEIVNFLLMTGNFGKAGAGACPVRGHSNVQGDRTMGIWERPSEAFLDNLKTGLGFDPPRHHGVDVVGAIAGLENGALKVFVSMGGNFLNASPDTQRTARAIARADLSVHVSTKLNRSHLHSGATSLILPCLARSERDKGAVGNRFVTVENSMGVVHRSEGKLRPCSPHVRSEPWIVCELAKATLAPARRVLDWSRLSEDYDAIRELIAKTLPAFANFNTRVRSDIPFYLPNPVRDERAFPTPDRKAHFSVNQQLPVMPAKDELVLMTVRSHDQYNTTIYGLDDRYRGIRGGRKVVFLNLDDITDMGFQADEWVDLVSNYNGQERSVDGFRIVPYAIPRRCAAAYFPEANDLVPLEEFAEGSRTPISKSVIIILRKRNLGN